MLKCVLRVRQMISSLVYFYWDSALLTKYLVIWRAKHDESGISFMITYRVSVIDVWDEEITVRELEITIWEWKDTAREWEIANREWNLFVRSGNHYTRIRNHHSKKSDAATWKTNLTNVVWVPTNLSSFCNRCVRILITVGDFLSQQVSTCLFTSPKPPHVNKNPIIGVAD